MDVIILNWNRSEYLKKKVIPILLQCDINKIIISHGRRDTYFPSNHDKIICVDNSIENDKYGLSLRFFQQKYMTGKATLILDDDLIFTKRHITDLIRKYNKNPNKIHGYFGRHAFFDKKSNKIIYSGFIANPKEPIKDIFESIVNLYKTSNIKPNLALTKMAIFPNESIDLFKKYWEKLTPFLKKNSKPLWNGEDITINLIYMKYTGQGAMIHKPYKKIYEHLSCLQGISWNKGHFRYRNNLCQYICKTINIDKKLLE